MSGDAARNYGSTLALFALGLLALYGGFRWLLVVVPAAALVWHLAARNLRAGRKLTRGVKIEEGHGVR